LPSNNNVEVQFNDLTRIHAPLQSSLHEKLDEVIKSSSYVLGNQVSDFEKCLAMAEGVEYAVGINNGTSAIQLALRALGIGAGDEVLTSPFTFVATTFAILEVGAIPVMVDIDPCTGLIDLDKLKFGLSNKTKALLFVTIHGRASNLGLYREFCDEHGLCFIIDGAQSHLAKNDGVAFASFADIATLSFYPGKNLGALGEGGAILTNSLGLKDEIATMRDWGASEKYKHDVWGGNFRLEAIQAAFLSVKIKHLEGWTKERIEIAAKYNQGLPTSLLMESSREGFEHVYHIYGIKVHNREYFTSQLKSALIGYGFHYPLAVHQQPHFSNRIKKVMPLNGAEHLAAVTLSLPIFPGMTSAEIERVISVIGRIDE
jgi:dTDP-4-amino-4,6-dideoxygalactose transaminase